MAGVGHRAPLGLEETPPDLRDGTLSLMKTPQPGHVHHLPDLTQKHKALYHRIHTVKGVLPLLRQGVKDESVRWVQILLNLHHVTTDPLKPDSFFGPKTHAAVVEFQQSKSLTEHQGVVGPETWTALQLIEPELPAHAGSEVAAAPRKVEPQKPQAVTHSGDESVEDWSLTHRFGEVVTNLAWHDMGPALRAQYKALLTPLNIGFLVSSLVALAVLQGTVAGEVIVAALGAVGFVLVRWAAFEAGIDIGKCMHITVSAKKYRHLEMAGAYLARAVAILGVIGLLTVLFRGLGRLRRGGGAEPKSGEPPPEEGDSPPDESGKGKPNKAAPDDSGDSGKPGKGFSGLKTAKPTGSALKDDINHRAASWMRDQAAENGSVFKITGGDGIQRTLIQMPGELNGTPGRFEYIVDGDGNLTHQMFVEGGSINGVPIKP
jgi:Putative peptidoglycan binding domain